MTKYLHHVIGGLIVTGIAIVFVAGMMFEHAKEFGITANGATSVPTTALAADHSTTSTTTGK